MAILVANIGTSDIAVKIGDRFFPIGFDRAERNLQTPDSGSLDAELWNNRTTRIREMARNDLGMELRDLKERELPPFREITQALLEAYQRDPQTWHPRIRISRIWGVIETARASKFLLKEVYLFVTDQPKTEKQGYSLDTIHAYGIIKCWIQHEFPKWGKAEEPGFVLKQETIDFKAVDEDRLFDDYYNFFQRFDRNEPLFISVKGGTPQMQTALRTQAIAADFKTQIFLEPKPDVARILRGEPSECDRIAYWRYQQTQKHHAVSRLLERWDFDGAVVLLQDWQETLQSLIDAQVTDENQSLQQRRSLIGQVFLGLETAVDCFNLDHPSALKQWQAIDDTQSKRSIQAMLENYNLPQALYAQCRIYQNLGEIAHFLARMGSFYEVAQLRAIKRLGGQQYLDPGKASKPTVLLRQLKRQNESLWRSIPENYRIKDGSEKREMSLYNRFLKKDYLKALMSNFSNSPAGINLSLWDQLDFWYDVRNDITHGSKGVNRQRIQEIYADRENRDHHACAYDEILEVMADILRQVSSSPLAEKSLEDFYIYSTIRDWAIAQLNTRS
jgi:hypothetical protein